MNIENARVTKKTLEKVVTNRSYNNIILDYYRRLEQEYQLKIDISKGRPKGKIKHKDLQHLNKLKVQKERIIRDKTLLNKIDSIEKCNKFWNLDLYEKLKIKDFISTNLCKDKFCANCKKVKQSSRMGKYIPELEKYPGKLYFLTLTQPNVPGKDLGDTIKKMSKSYSYLNRYLNGTKKINGLDFDYLKYLGGVRSLEVTFKKDDYHPHLHVILVLDNENVPLDNYIINKYSYDYSTGKKVLKTLFSDLDILIQKIWYLLMNDVKVTKKNIENLELGYSCRIDKLQKNDFLDIFKYMTKEKDEDGKILTYENFKTLYYALYRVKQIQGYGCLYHIKDTIDVEKVEEIYNQEIEKMKKIEVPVSVFEKPSELLSDNKYELISRKSYMKYYNQVMMEPTGTKP